MTPIKPRRWSAAGRLFQPPVLSRYNPAVLSDNLCLSRYMYDVSPDGQRFLVSTLPEEAASTPLTLVVNWTAGLKK